MPAARSEAIAARCGLNERYVREWLGAMVSSGVVDYDPRDGTYALPPEHAAFLTRAATPSLFWPSQKRSLPSSPRDFYIRNG
jgi:DNA-binding IclR family transcriptional regulator